MSYHTNSILKHIAWGTFCFLEGLALVPLIELAGVPVVFNAIAATGVMMGLLGAYAYNTPTEVFLSLEGVLHVGLTGLIGVSVATVFWPTPLLTCISLYGGLILFGGFVLLDTCILVDNAEKKHLWDPINESLNLYMDAIIIFKDFLIIMIETKDEDNEEKEKNTIKDSSK